MEEKEILQLKNWDLADEAGQARAGREIVALASAPVEFVGLEMHAQGRQRRRVAMYAHEGCRFALVPGGQATLGFDAERFELTAAQRASYQEGVDDFGMPEEPREYFANATTKIRTVAMESMLVEVEAREIGVEPIALDAPEVVAAIKEFKRTVSTGFEIYKKLRLRKMPDGTMWAWRIRKTERPEVVRRVASGGMRMLSPDEWEYVCAAGTRTLFRWGDDCPSNRYPIDSRLPDSAGGASKGGVPGSPDDPAWAENRRPNAFGLSIAADPYEVEITSEPGGDRGGDGGGSICGGMGYFLGWFPLASSFLPAVGEPGAETADPDLSNCWLRRVIKLEP